MTTPQSGADLADQVSRTDLLLGRRGIVSSLTDTNTWFAQRPVQVRAGGATAVSAAGQSALITLVTLLHRAGFPVVLNRAFDDVRVDAGPFRGQQLATTLERLGATIAGPIEAEVTGQRTVLIGAVSDAPSPSIQLTWDGWIAGVRPGGERLGERDGCPLAPLLAAALTVSEIFESHLGVRDACWRDATISLWTPTGTTPEQGPPLRWLPEQWMLIGLGHLGQAHAWCLSHLPYQDGSCEAWLVDDERITESNVSTGIFTSPEHLARETGPAHKTRLVSGALERAGLHTRLIERRLQAHERYHQDLPPIALVGVDNLDIRCTLSAFEWPLCVDAGLGSTPSSFDTFSIHSFDGTGRGSHEIEAWQQRPIEPDTGAPIFDDLRGEGLDECGIVTLANKNVACAYVGMAAACLSVAEVLRRLNGGHGTTAISTALDALVVRGDAATPPALRASVCEVTETGRLTTAPAEPG